VDPKTDLPSGHTDVMHSGATCEQPLQSALRELREEAGIVPQDVQYLGVRVHRTAADFQPYGAVKRHFFFFAYTAHGTPQASRGHKLGTQDFYNASSWVRPAHIAAQMKFVDGVSAASSASSSPADTATTNASGFTTAQQCSRFFTLRKFALAEDVADMLDGSATAACPLEVGEADKTLFAAAVAASVAMSSGGNKSGNHYVPPIPAGGASSSSSAHGGKSEGSEGKWHSSGGGGSSGAYRPPTGGASSGKDSFSSFTSAARTAPAAPSSVVSPGTSFAAAAAGRAAGAGGAATAPAPAPVTGTDKKLRCERCPNTFVFLARDQAFYKEKGYEIPKRCEKCRAEKKK
jgi:ADP-ribose pyrophosphatase YjhB (NUDIX family)